MEGVALISSMINKSNERFIDSAATKHMTSNKSILENYVQYQEPKSIYLGDSTIILAYGKGKVKLLTVNNTRRVVLDIFLCTSRSPSQNRANAGQANHMKLYTEMYVAQCKWNQKAAVNIC